MRRMAIVWAAAIGIIYLTGCTSFHGQLLRSDGTVLWEIREMTAPLISRNTALDVTLQWLDEETNTLYETRLRRYSDEQADAQARMADRIERLAAGAAR